MSKKRFRLESIGYFSHKYSVLTLIIIAAITVFMWFGQDRIVFNSNVTDMFKSNNAEFSLFERVEKIFNPNNNEMLLTISGKNLTTPKNIEKLSNLQLELEFDDRIKGVISPFSMRDFPDADGNIGALFPAEITADNVDSVLQKAQTHPLVGQKLLSKDGELVLFIINIIPPKVSAKAGEGKDNAERLALLGLRTELLEFAQEKMGDESLSLEMSGVGIFKAEIIGYMLYDQAIFTYAGILFGFFISYVYFRRLKFVLLAGLPTVVAMFTMRGTFGWFDIEMDVLSNIAPLLIMVISFCDSMHLVYGIRRRMEQGFERDLAIRETIKHVGPACVLTSLTTGIAMVSLLMAQHPIISKFGLISALGTGFAFVVTLTLIPALGKLILPKKMNLNPVVTAASDGYRHPFIHRILDRYTDFCKILFMRWSKQITIASIILMVVLGAFYVQNETRYRYLDNLPQNNQAFIGVTRIEEKLAGSNEIRIFIEFDKDYNLRNEQTFALYKDVEEQLLQTKFVKQTLSLATLREYVQKNTADKTVDGFYEFVDNNTDIFSGLLREDDKQSLVLGLLPDTDASALLPDLQLLTKNLKQLEEKYPFATLHVTGILPLTAKSSYDMIYALNYSLLLAIMGGVFLVAIAFRSVYAGIFTLIANLIPIGLAGLYLYFMNAGLQFTSVVAFTIGFGIAVDNTIHIVHRFNRAISDGLDIEKALKVTMDSVTSVLVVTSLVLGFGIGIVVVSEMPLIKLYGVLLMMLVMTALFTDTLLLPSAMRIIYNYERRKRNKSKK